MKTTTIEFDSDISEQDRKKLIEEIETDIKLATGKRGGVLVVTSPSDFKTEPRIEPVSV